MLKKNFAIIKRSGIWLIAFPAIVLAIWGLVVSRPKPPVPFDKSHIQSEVIEQIARQLTGRSWHAGNMQIKFKQVHVLPAKGVGITKGSYFVLQKNRIKIMLLIDGEARVRGQKTPFPSLTIKELHLKRQPNNSVFNGDIRIPGYGIVLVSFPVDDQNNNSRN